MKNKTARWLLCVVLALVLVASFVLVACKPDEEQPATYTLTFALGDHAAADAKAPDAIERKAGETVNMPNAPKAADGWEFDGWGSSKLAAGASFTMPAENTTLTAQWKQKPGPTPTTYTLTFALGDHAAADATAPEAKSYEAGAEVTLPDAPKADTGWQFDGWGDSKLAAGAKYTMPAQATTLTAQWKELPFTTELFDLEYEWAEESEPTFFFALSKEDENFTLLADGEKMGNYAAEINADGTFKLTANDDIYEEGQSNPFSAVSVSLNGRTLTVNFTYGSKSYTKAVEIVKVDLVNYNGADGKLTVYVVKGSEEDLSGYAETSEPADKKLDTVTVGETVLTEEQYSAYAINSDITVTYTWKSTAPTYTVTLKAGSAADEAEGDDQNITITDGNTYTFVDPTDKYGFSYEGYSFVGWKLEGDSTDHTYAVGDTYTFEGDVTSIVAYATWEEDEIPPFATGGFVGVIIDMESGYVIAFSDGTAGGDLDGYYYMIIRDDGSSKPWAGSYLYQNEDGMLTVYKLVDSEPVLVGAGGIEEGNMIMLVLESLPTEGAPSATADGQSEDDGSEVEPLVIEAEMYTLTITVGTSHNDIYVNAGAPIYSVAMSYEPDQEITGVTFNGTALNLEEELGKVEEREGYTAMPSADAQMTITVEQKPFTTEAFNVDLSWEQKVTKSGSEVPVSVKLTAEKKSSSWSGELTLTSSDTDLDDYDTITFTMDANGSISLTSGMDKFSGTGKLAGNTLSITFTYKTYTFTCQADLVKLTFQNDVKEEETKVVYANEGNAVKFSDWGITKFSNSLTPEQYYFFNGWSDGDQTYGNDGVITVVKETTITPVWEKGYIVTFVVGVDESEIKQYHSQLSFYEDFVGAIRPSDAAKFVVPKNILPYTANSDNYIYREGYDVTWKCSCHPNQTLNPSEEHALTGDVTFTATWTAKEFEVTYDLGAFAAEGQEVPQTEHHKTGDTFTLPNGVTGTGNWEFAGWYDGEKTTEAGQQYTMLPREVKFVAEYKIKENKKIAVSDFFGLWTFDMGYSFPVNYDGIWLQSDGQDGYKLQLHNKGSRFEEAVEEITLTEDTDAGTLTLQWGPSTMWNRLVLGPYSQIKFVRKTATAETEYPASPISFVKVTFDLGEGKDKASGAPATQNVFPGGLADAPTDPTWSLHRVEGWYKDGSEFAFNFKYTPVSEDITLTAHWELSAQDFFGIWKTETPFVPYGEVQLNTLELSESGLQFGSYSKIDGNNLQSFSLELSDKNQLLVKGSFGTWDVTITCSEDALTAKFVQRGGDGVQDITYSKPTYVDVKFDLGEWSEGTPPATQKVMVGDKAKEVEPDKRTKYRFLGWFASNADTKFDFSTPITEELTLTAHWEEITDVTVTFDANAGEDEVSNMPGLVETTYGQTIDEPTSKPTRDGYEFQGWGSSATSKDKIDFTKTQILDNTTFYAIWKKYITITFKVEGKTDTISPEKILEGTPLDLTGAKYQGVTSSKGLTFLGWKIENNPNIISNPKMFSVNKDTTLVAVFGKEYDIKEGTFYYDSIIIRDDEYLVLCTYDGGYVDQEGPYRYEGPDAKGIYEYSDDYGGIYFFKIDENGEIVFADAGIGTYTTTFDTKPVTLDLDGYGKATLSFDGNQQTGTYVVQGSYYSLEVAITFGSDESTLKIVQVQAGFEVKIVEGFLKVADKTFVFGQPKVTVTYKIGSTQDTQEVTYGGHFVYEEEIPDSDGKQFYGWTKDGEDFDVESQAITEPITLEAKFLYSVQFWVNDAPRGAIWDEDDDGKIEDKFPTADLLEMSDWDITGWVDYAEYEEKEGNIEQCTQHKPEDPLSATESKIYVAVASEKKFLIDGLFFGYVGYTEVGEYYEGRVELDNGGNFQAYVTYSGGVSGKNMDVSGTYTNDGGKLILTLDEEYITEGWTVYTRAIGRHVLIQFIVDGDTFSFEGDVYKLTVKNWNSDEPESSLEYWVCAGMNLLDFYLYDTVEAYKINGTQYAVEDLEGDASKWLTMPEEDVTIEYVRGEAADVSITGLFNASVPLKDGNGEIAFEESGNGQIRIRDKSSSAIKFSYTNDDKLEITFSDGGGSVVSAEINGRTISITIKLAGDDTSYTFEATFYKLTVKNYSKSEPDKTYEVWCAAEADLGDYFWMDDDYSGAPSYNVDGQTISPDQIESDGYQMPDHDITIEFVWPE